MPLIRILAAEDDGVTTTRLKSQLEELGYQVAVQPPSQIQIEIGRTGAPAGIETQALLASLLAHAPTSIYVTGADGQLRLVSRRWEMDTGQAAADVIGKPLAQVFGPDLARHFDEDNRRVVETDAPLSIEETIDTQAGLRQFLTVKFPLRDAQGRVEAVGGISLDITERQQIENQLRSSLAEKEVLLKEIHHRVKNNLQVIVSLLSLQAHTAMNETVRTILSESESRVRAIASVHEQLYQSGDLSHVNFGDYVQRLAEHLFSTFLADPGNIQIEIDIRGILLTVNHAIPCGLIVNELLSNCCKYAFPDRRQGVIHVHMNESEGMYTLQVSDNGIGLPPGLDILKTNTLGMQITTALVSQLHGTLTVESNHGASFQIKFPR